MPDTDRIGRALALETIIPTLPGQIVQGFMKGQHANLADPPLLVQRNQHALGLGSHYMDVDLKMTQQGFSPPRSLDRNQLRAQVGARSGLDGLHLFGGQDIGFSLESVGLGKRQAKGLLLGVEDLGLQEWRDP